MKLCYFNDYRLGVIKGDNVVDVTDAVKDIPHLDARDLIIGLIAKWDSYKAKVEKAAADGKGVPVSGVKLRPPVPKPGNIVCMAVNYMEDGTLPEKPAINAFHKAHPRPRAQVPASRGRPARKAVRASPSRKLQAMARSQAGSPTAKPPAPRLHPIPLLPACHHSPSYSIVAAPAPVGAGLPAKRPSRPVQKKERL